MGQLPFAIPQAVVDFAVADARVQFSAVLIGVLRDINHQDQLAPIIGDFTAILTRAYAESLISNGHDPSDVTAQLLWIDGPLRDPARLFWRPWDDFVRETWEYDLRHTAEDDACPFLLTKLPMPELLTGPALRRMEQVLANIRDDPPVHEKRRATSEPDEEPQFSKRALWLAERLQERSWNKHDVSRNRGPDHKTVQKILEGKAVREDMLDKLARALSEARVRHLPNPTVTVLDIPKS